MIPTEHARSREPGPDATDQNPVPDYVLLYLSLEAFKGFDIQTSNSTSEG